VWRRAFSFSLRAERPGLSLADLTVGLGTLTLLYVVARVGAQAFVRFSPPDFIPSVNLDSRNLPNF
jgi:hypothetical protein